MVVLGGLVRVAGVIGHRHVSVLLRQILRVENVLTGSGLFVRRLFKLFLSFISSGSISL
jgi:hypothetical protein